MDSKLKFKIVVEQDNKELASAILGHEILAEIASRQVNWREEAIYADLHQYLINFPHPTVWQNVAGVTLMATQIPPLMATSNSPTLMVV